MIEPGVRHRVVSVGRGVGGGDLTAFALGVTASAVGGGSDGTEAVREGRIHATT